MDYGHSIRACFDVWKIAGGGPFGDRGLGVDQGFIAVFWEAVTGRVAVTYNLPFFVPEPADFYMHQARWGRSGLGQDAWPKRQLVCARRLANNRSQGAGDVWRGNRRNHP
jgi:hypothetical protein